MADKPILFSAPMIRALLEGTKTQTRRIIEQQPEINDNGSVFVHGRHLGCLLWGRHATPEMIASTLLECASVHAVGDRLWTRETLRFDLASYDWLYGADGSVCVDVVGTEPETPTLTRWPNFVCVSIHQPRALSRLTLIVEDVRVQRLRDISKQDAIAEGATARKSAHGEDWWSMDWARLGSPGFDGKPLTASCMGLRTPQSAFGSFINELHDRKWSYKGDGIFGANPWVAAYTFRVIRANIDQVAA